MGNKRSKDAQKAGPLIGLRLGSYELLEQVGTGGMSTVYKGLDHKLLRNVAIKILHAQFLTDSSVLLRFKREALASAQLDHPSIVRVYDYVEENGLVAIIMEFIPGKNADSLITEKGPFPFDAAQSIMGQIATALQRAHQTNILHRDMKPSNIMLHQDGRAMLTDFGLAQQISDIRITMKDAVAGTPQFMSPEQISGQSLTASTDIYSWAITFHYLLTGQLPYPKADFAGLVSCVESGEVQWKMEDLAGLPACYLSLLERCCVHDPKKRIADGDGLVRAIEQCRAESMVGRRTAGDRAILPDRTIIFTPGEHKKKKRTKRLAVAIAGAAIALLLSILGFQNYQSSRPPSTIAPAIQIPDTKMTPVETKIAPSSHLTGTASAPNRARTILVPASLPDSGQLFVFSQPWAEVFIDGQPRGRTPMPEGETIRLPAGHHEVVLKSEYCQEFRDTVQIVANQLARKRYSLKLKPEYETAN